MSCKTIEKEKIIYDLPEINWIDFPELGEYEKLDDGRIAVDSDYFRQLLIFKIQYLNEKEKYEERKKLLEYN